MVGVRLTIVAVAALLWSAKAATAWSRSWASAREQAADRLSRRHAP